MEISYIKKNKHRLLRTFLIALSFFIFQLFISNTHDVDAFSIVPNGVEEKNAILGSTLELKFKIKSQETSDKTYELKPVNVKMVGDYGEYSYIEPGQGGRFEFANWVEINKEVKLKAGEEKEIDYQVNIPEDASPGGHYGAILVLQKHKDSYDANVGVAGGISFLNFIHIPGNAQENLEIELKAMEPKFVTEIPKEYELTFINKGNVYLMPVNNIYIEKDGDNIDTINANPEFKLVLPESQRKVEVERLLAEDVGEVSHDTFFKDFFKKLQNQANDFRFGRYTATAKIVYGENMDKLAEKKISFYVIPWHLFLVVGIFGFLIIIPILWLLKLKFLKKKGRKSKE